MKKEIDSSPQAIFVKNILRKENPSLSEEELERIWQEKLLAAERELGESACSACGS